jgi:hypothetical protein
MTKSEIVEAVHDKTRRLAENVIDMEGLYVECLQEMCRAYRWPWRRKWATFPTVAATATYDLTSTSASLPGATDIEEFIGVFRIDSATSQTELVPIDDETAMVAAQASAEQGEVTGYFLEPGSHSTIHLVKVPAAVVNLRAVYWAIPNPESSTGTIPLLPPVYHHILKKRMEAEVWACLPGEGIESPNYRKAMSQYLAGLEQALMKTRTAVGQTNRFASAEAVRST